MTVKYIPSPNFKHERIDAIAVPLNRDLGPRLEERAKFRAPHETGELEESIHVVYQRVENAITIEGMTVEGTEIMTLIAEANHAAPQEVGWLGNPGQPFLRPSVIEVIGNL